VVSVKERITSSWLLQAVRIITFLLGAFCLASSVILALSLDTHERVPVARTSTMVIAGLLGACAFACFVMVIRRGGRPPGFGSAALVIASAFVNAAALGASVRVQPQQLLSQASVVVGLVLGTWFLIVAADRVGDKPARSVL
jgi:cytochrome bd-type quinol oxidase subunit 2